MQVIGIIPARLQSTRIANKPLLEFNNKPLLQHTYEAVKQSGLFDHIYIATDSKMIQKTAENFNAKVIITSKANKNGTERCIELIKKNPTNTHNNDLIINIQCDEPFLQKKHFKAIIKLMRDDIQIATLISPIKKIELQDTNVVKASINDDFTAANFSRFIKNFNKKDTLYKHIGIYAFKKHTLLKIAELNEVKIEKKESLEQLRWLKNNYIIQCEYIKEDLISINSFDDVKKVLKK